MRGLIGLVIGIILAGLLSAADSQNLESAQAAEVGGVVPPGAYLTEFTARSTTAPRRDNYSLYNRLRGGPANISHNVTKPTYQVGDQETFNVFDLQQKRPYQVKATVVAVTPHLYMFVDNNFGANRDALAQLAQQFENKVYPTTRRYFGSEDTPGVDNDPHLVILNTSLKLASGYFSSDDTLVKTINPVSNEREMFYIATNPTNSTAYLSTLSHEFQHMIEYHTLPNQDIWLNEGSSVLSQVLNGYGTGGLEVSFLNQPSTQLDSWTCSACPVQPHYGAGYTWLSFLKDRYGFETVRSIADNGHALTGLSAVDYALYANNQPDQTSDSVFKQFVLANYLNRRSADPAYNYKDISTQVQQTLPLGVNLSHQDSLNQYAATYFTVTGGPQGFSLDFKGNSTVGVVPNAQAHSGQYAWWTGRGDNSEMSLTRDVDLSAVKSATFKFWTWFDIEPSYDWLYVEASSDGGQTWQVLPGQKYTTDRDPSGKQYGPGMTGQSTAAGLSLSDSETVRAEWVADSVDLSKYAGQKIKLRLDYLTDEGYNRSGALFDDFEIPEIGWKDDGEGNENGWEAAGFLRSNLTLPQHFAVQVIRRDGPCGQASAADLSKADNGQSCIREVPLDATNAGRQQFPYSQAIVVVAPWAVKTLAPATYILKVGS